MMKSGIIKITGIQGLDDQQETVEFTTEGRFGLKGEEILLSYEEGELFGLKGIHTTLHITPPNTAVLKRTGAMETRLLIQKGVRSECRYRSDIGELNLGITGETLDLDFSESGGTIRFSYRIDSGMKPVSKNRIEITVREV